MERENRYIIIKRKDVDKYLSHDQKNQLAQICMRLAASREADGRPNIKAAVIESDWPMYEQVWQLVEEWVNGVESFPKVGARFR